MKNTGISLIEMSIVLALTGTIMGLASQSWNYMNHLRSSALSHEEADLRLMALTNLVLKVGRVAQSCNRVQSGNNQELRCQIDLHRPPTGVLTWVRFVLVGNAIEYQSDNSGTGMFLGPATLLQRFSNASRFLVCNDADMNLNASGSCAIEPLELSRVHSANIGLRGGRFFRFQIFEQLDLGKNSIINTAFQGAFYVSNPTASWAPPQVSYSW